MQNFAIRSQRILRDNQFFHGVMFIENGRIHSFGTEIPESYDGHIIDCGTDAVLPGLIDPHVHINEPGRTEWEGFETATKAAAAGGITTVIDMPLNSSPVTTTLPNLNVKVSAAKNKLYINAGFYGGVVKDNANDIESLLQNGVYGIKAFLTHSGIDDFPDTGEKELLPVLKLLKKYNLPLLVHAELSIPHEGQKELKNNPDSYMAYLNSRPRFWEDEAIAMMIRLCRESGAHVHIVHLSSSDSIEQITKARAEGLPLTVETGPHYLFFNAEEIPDKRTVYKCAPPIREKKNNELLWKALEQGVIDFIATDHSPAPPDIKAMDTGNLAEAWGGIAGLQFSLPAIWKKASERNISLQQVIQWMSTNPAAFLQLNKKGKLAEGMDADFFIFNPDVDNTPETDEIYFRHKISPYIGQKLKGRIVHTYVNGTRVFDKGKFITSAGTTLLKNIN